MDPSEVKEEFERTRIAEKDAIAILLQAEKIRELFPGTVSYTHLTLPTKA